MAPAFTAEAADLPAPGAPAMPGGGVPVNDLCSNITPEALTMGSSLSFSGDNTNATFDGDAVPGSLLDQFPFPDTWHAFTTTECTSVTVSYCATDSGWSNVWRLLTTQCPADSVIQASNSDQTTCANGNWTFSFNQLAPGTYYLPVPHVGFGQGGGPYNIQVSATACSNDLCSNISPETLAIGGTLNFIGDNTNATFPGDAEPGSLLDQFPFPNTWHAFTTTECTRVTVSYCATDSGWSNVWRLLTTQCPADSVIQASSSDQTTCANGNWTFSFDQLAPGTYYLPVPNVGFGQGGGSYSIEVNAAPCSNDFCANVIPVALAIGGSLTFTGNNTNATFNGDAVPGFLLDQFPFPNTWHAFTTTECTRVTVSYCATDSGWSNVWRLLTTQCPADSVIQASSTDQTTCANGNWTFSFDELAAGTYFLPVPNVGFGQGGGPYTINVNAAPCSNDFCINVIPAALTIGGSLTFTGNNTNATFDGDAVPGSLLDQFPFPNTWHAFTTTECTSVTVSYCATDSGWSNVWRLLTTQCPAESVINATSMDTTTCANGNWTFSFDELAAGTYYLPVPNVGFGQGGGAYDISVSAAPCSNDLCANVIAQPIAIGGSLIFTGNNTNATFDGDAVPGSLLAQFPFPNTWHAFTTTECATMVIDYCNTDSGWSNVWRLLTTQCPANTVINASNADTITCANGNWTIRFTNLPSGTYYLPVPNTGFGQGGGAYTIEVSAVLCSDLPPAYDLCADVTAAALAVDSTLNFTGDNTNATFAGDAAPGTILDQYPFPNTWHAFTVSECSDVSVSYCTTDSGWSNVWQLLTTDCPADSIINVYGADTTSCGNGNWTFSFHQLQPGTYYLPVPNTGFGQGGGAYNIDVSAAACVPDHVRDANSSGDWSVFPNPTNGEVTIIAPRDMGTATLELIEMTGRTMYRTQLVMTAGNSHQLSLARHIAPGTYALRMTTANGRSTQLLILK